MYLGCISAHHVEVLGRFEREEELDHVPARLDRLTTISDESPPHLDCISARSRRDLARVIRREQYLSLDFDHVPLGARLRALARVDLQ